MGRPRIPLADRFWNKVDKMPGHGPQGECWVWIAATNPDGYGMIRQPTRTIIASRASWEIHHGPVPDGLWVLHRCDNPPCVNPNHLFLGTTTDNQRDAAKKGRSAKGGNNARITEDQVREIRQQHADGVNRRILAAQYGVTHWNITAIVNRTCWPHVI